MSLPVPDDTWQCSAQPALDGTAPIHVQFTALPAGPCPACGAPLTLHQGRQYVVADLPYGDHAVLWMIPEARHACTCGWTRDLCPDGVQRGRHGTGWTDALAEYLPRHTHEPLDLLRDRTGLPVNRIRELQAAARVQAAEPDPTQVEAMGIDEIYVNRSRLTVITDIGRRRLLRLQAVASTVDGLADRIDIRRLLEELPAPQRIALDMNPAVIAAVRLVWPDATLVIDKRHALQTADRSMQQVIRALLEQRQTSLPAPGKQRFQTMYGEAGFQLNYLKRFVMRRPSAMGPGDVARWTLLHRESPMLWEAYQRREALYTLLTQPHSQEQVRDGLDRWRDTTNTWLDGIRKRDPGVRLPLTASLWMIRFHGKRLVQFGDGELTNAFTESVNSRIREHVRRGRRYDPRTVIHLVNEELAAEQPEHRRAPGADLTRHLRGNPAPLPIPADPPPVPPPVEASRATPQARSLRSGRKVAPVRSAPLDLPEVVQTWWESGGTRTRDRRRAEALAVLPPELRQSYYQACDPAGEAPSAVDPAVRYAILSAYHRSHPAQHDLASLLCAPPSDLPRGALGPVLRLSAQLAAGTPLSPDAMCTRQTLRRVKTVRSHPETMAKARGMLGELEETLGRWRQACTSLPDYAAIASGLRPQLNLTVEQAVLLLSCEPLQFPLMASMWRDTDPPYLPAEVARLQPDWARAAADILKMSKMSEIMMTDAKPRKNTSIGENPK